MKFTIHNQPNFIRNIEIDKFREVITIEDIYKFEGTERKEICELSYADFILIETVFSKNSLEKN